MKAAGLPSPLVKRMRRIAAERIKRHGAEDFYRTLGRMKPVDPRRRGLLNFLADKKDARVRGGRLREMNVSKNFPNTKAVFKVCHTYPARVELKIIKNFVKWKNKTTKSKSFKLLQPKAYVVGKWLLAMPKIEEPTVRDILGYPKLYKKKINTYWGWTKKGKQFFKKLKEKHGITEEQLRETSSATGVFCEHLFLLDYKDGKFVFRPGVDIELGPLDKFFLNYRG